MRNYERRFRLHNRKWAYMQLSALAEAAKLDHICGAADMWPLCTCTEIVPGSAKSI